MAELATYYRMRPGKGYLAGVDVGPDEDLEMDDVLEAELWAKERIDELLGKRFANDPLTLVPPTIRKCAQQLAAAYCLDIAERNSTTHAGVAWRKMAEDELKAIRKRTQGLKLADGSWDPDFIGSENAEEGNAGGVSIIAQ